MRDGRTFLGEPQWQSHEAFPSCKNIPEATLAELRADKQRLWECLAGRLQPRVVNHPLMFTEAKSQCVVVLIWHTLGLREYNRWRGQLSGCAPCQLIWLTHWALFWWAMDWVKYLRNCPLPHTAPARPHRLLHFYQHLPEAVGVYAAKRIRMLIFMNQCRFLKSSCYSAKWAVINYTLSRPIRVNQNCLYLSKWSFKYKRLFVYLSNQTFVSRKWRQIICSFLKMLWIALCCC